MSIYKPNERARLSVGGGSFEDWTSVWVQRTWGNSTDQFKFTCAERDGASAGQVSSSAKFKPGDQCRIELANQLAITGTIVTRQAAYDGNSHGVELQGTSKTWGRATSSVVHKTNNFDRKTFKEIVKEVLEETGWQEGRKKGFYFEGTPPKELFDHCTPEKGETIWNFFERLARQVKVVMSSNEDGDWVFVCEDVKKGSQGQLIEGENILKMQAIISQERAFKKVILQGSMPASNGKDPETDKEAVAYRAASEIEVEREGDYEGDYRTLIVPGEQPIDKETLEKRADNEVMWQAGSQLNATIVVYGWQPGGAGALWEPGCSVMVNSPMAMLSQELKIQSVTYTQDNNSGTTTTLVCVAPWALQGPKGTA